MADTNTITLRATTLVLKDEIRTPCSVCLRSADAARAIQLSFDNGVEYFTPTYDFTSATALDLSLLAPALVKVTGAIGDTVCITNDTVRSR
jgi:hypothetical protein